MTPNRWLLNAFFIVIIVYFSLICIGKAYEIYASIVVLHNLEERIDRFEQRRSSRPERKQGISGVPLCGRIADDVAI